MESPDYLQRKIDQHVRTNESMDDTENHEKHKIIFEIGTESNHLYVYEFGDTRLSFEYEDVVMPELPDDYDKFCIDWFQKRRVGELISLKDNQAIMFGRYVKEFHLEPHYIKRLKYFKLEKSDQVLDLGEIFSKTSVFVSTNVNVYHKDLAGYDFRFNQIYVLGYGFNTVDGLIALLHELGHVSHALKKPDDLDAAAAYVNGDEVDSRYNMGKLIEAERDAWSFAIHSIKHFVKDLGFTIEDILETKNSALSSYISRVSEDISERKLD